MSDSRLLVPVAPSETLRQTVEYAVRTAFELEGTQTATVRFVYVHPAELDEDDPEDEYETATALLDRVTAWAREDAGDREENLTVETAHLGADRYIFSPTDLAAAIAGDVRASDVDRVVIDPEYDPRIGAPLVRPLEYELTQYGEFDVDEAPVSVRTRRSPLLERTSLAQLGALFLIAFGFYQVLGGNFTWLAVSPTEWASEIYWFDVITGAVSAAVVAIGLSRVTFTDDPTRQTLGRLARHVVYVPYLLKEIIKANIEVAFVILHPQLPIDPRLTHVRPALWGALPMTTYANSVTLTPGTLSVRVDGRRMLVHTLIPDAREDLFDGGLERAVRLVFYGRGATQIPSLRDRGEAELVAAESVQQDDSTTPVNGDDSEQDAHSEEGDADDEHSGNGDENDGHSEEGDADDEHSDAGRDSDGGDRR